MTTRSQRGKNGKGVLCLERTKAERPSSLHDRLSKVAGKIAKKPKTGKKAGKKFFDELSGH